MPIVGSSQLTNGRKYIITHYVVVDHFELAIIEFARNGKAKVIKTIKNYFDQL